MKILTSTQEEYDNMIRIAEENNIPKVNVYPPKDSHASVVWSIDDIKNIIPEGNDFSDEELSKGLEHISKSIISNMLASGWETIEILKFDIVEAIGK